MLIFEAWIENRCPDCTVILKVPVAVNPVAAEEYSRMASPLEDVLSLKIVLNTGT